MALGGTFLFVSPVEKQLDRTEAVARLCPSVYGVWLQCSHHLDLDIPELLQLRRSPLWASTTFLLSNH